MARQSARVRFGMKTCRAKAGLLILFCVVTAFVVAAEEPVFTPDMTEVPFAKIAQRHEIDRTCPNTGKKDNNLFHYAQNAAKNNFSVKGASIPIAFTDFDRLEQSSRQKIEAGEIKLEGKYPADRALLQNLIKIDGKPAGEGTAVSLEAYVFNAQYVNTKFNLDKEGHGRHGEAVDCDNPELDWNDMHIALCATSNPNTEECLTVTAEISPHYRPAIWSRFHDGQNALVEAVIPGLLKQRVVQNHQAGTELVRVRLSGPLFYDASHTPCNFDGEKVTERHAPLRRAIWEIHPVYRIEIFETKDNKWIDLDQWAEFKGEGVLKSSPAPSR
jgi:hypothetical protein